MARVSAVRPWMLQVCIALALLTTVAPSTSARPVPQSQLLQGQQGSASVSSILGSGKVIPERVGAGADAGRATLQKTRQEEFLVLRDMIAVSQVLEGEESPGPRVKVEIFTSASCRVCRSVFHAAIAKTLQKDGIMDIVDLDLVLWGDGDVIGEDGVPMGAEGIAGLEDATGINFSCARHSDPSCAGNIWEACLESEYPNVHEYFPVLNCIEGRACAEGEQAPAQCWGSVTEVAPVCASEFGEGIVNADTLKECAEGDVGRALLLANAKATTALDPPMGFMPWIVVDGHALGAGKEEELLLGKAICDAYAAKGGMVPYSCSRFPQTLDEMKDPWGHGPSVDDYQSVPSVIMSDRSSGVSSGICMLVVVASFALALAYCFCEPREQDEGIFDAIGGRPLSRAGYTPAPCGGPSHVNPLP